MLATSLVYREEISSCVALDAVWTLSVRHDLLGSLPYLTLPDGCLGLIYRLKKDASGKIDSAALLIAGPTYRPATFFPTAGEEFIGVRFAPGWGGLVTGVSPQDLFETFTEARCVSPRLARLEEDLLTCESQRQATSLLRLAVEGWANERRTKLEIQDAVRMLRICGGQVRVDQVARHLGLSTRSFRRGVKELSGLSPKGLSCIFRFRRTLDRINESTGMSLGRLALEAGYTDQAHMTREFRLLGGFTPRFPDTLTGKAPLQEEM